MKSFTTPQFWKLYNALPPDIQKRADKAYQLWQVNPSARSLYFKRVHAQLPIYSVRISRGYRALGVQKQSGVTWFWIGSHDAYERLLKTL